MGTPLLHHCAAPHAAPMAECGGPHHIIAHALRGNHHPRAGRLGGWASPGRGSPAAGSSRGHSPGGRRARRRARLAGGVTAAGYDRRPRRTASRELKTLQALAGCMNGAPTATGGIQMNKVRGIISLPAGRRAKWIVLAGWLIVVAVAGPLAGKLGSAEQNDARSWPPATAESARVLDLQ